MFAKFMALDMRIKMLVSVAVLIVGLILLSSIWPFYSVPTGSRGVVTQFGKIINIESEGLTLLPPWRKLAVFSIRSEQADVENAQGSTSDTQPVDVSLTVRYSILPDKVAYVYENYSHDGDLSSYVQTATQEVFKAVTAKYTAPDLIAKRSTVSGDIYMALGVKMALYGAKIVNIDMRNFAFSDSYMKAINDKVTQEQLRLAAENKLKTVESEQKQKVAVAEAEAAATVATAHAQAESLKSQQAALSAGPQILELRRIEVERIKAEKWDGKLPEAIYASAPIPFLNVGSK